MLSDIHYVSINDPMWRGRATKIHAVDRTGRMQVVSEIPVPDGEIICDMCNVTISDPDWLDAPDPDDPDLPVKPERVAMLGTWGALCEDCVRRMREDSNG
jgi:hypothetical protein